MTADDINRERGKKQPENGSEVNREIKKLRAEVIELKRERGESVQPSGKNWRWTTAIVLVVIACILAPLAVTALWLNRTIMDTDTYVETVAPLSKDKAIQSAVSNFAATELFSKIDAESLARQALPDQADFLAGPITQSLKGFVRDATQRLVASSRFQKVWVKTNRVAHEQAIKLITGEGNAAITESGEVTLDLGGVMGNVSSGLQRSGIDIFNGASLPEGKITIFESATLARIKTGVDTLNRLAIWLPLLVIGFLIGAVALSPRRLRIILWSGIGLSISMAALLIALIITRFYYLDAVVGGFITEDAARALFDTLVRSLRSAGIYIFIFGAVVATGATLAGPSPAATRIRRTIVGDLRGAGSRWDFGTAGNWVYNHKNGLRAAGLIIGFITLVLWSEPTLYTLLGIVVVELIYLAALEIFGQPLVGQAEPREKGEIRAV